MPAFPANKEYTSLVKISWEEGNSYNPVYCICWKIRKRWI